MRAFGKAVALSHARPKGHPFSHLSDLRQVESSLGAEAFYGSESHGYNQLRQTIKDTVNE